MIEMASSEPNNIEAMSELKAYIDDAENQMKGLRTGIEAMVDRLGALEEFQFLQVLRAYNM